jgi:hypothetical protein
MHVTITLELPNGTSITLGNLKAILEKGRLVDFKTETCPLVETPSSGSIYKDTKPITLPGLLGKKKTKVITVEDASKQSEPEQSIKFPYQKTESVVKENEINLDEFTLVKEKALADINSVKYMPGMNITNELTQIFNQVKSYGLPKQIDNELLEALSTKGKTLIGEDKLFNMNKNIQGSKNNVG